MAPYARALAYPKCPYSPRLSARTPFAYSRGRPQLASLPPCISPTISEPADVSLDGKGHPRPASTLRRSACAQRPSHAMLTRCILGARPHHGRLLCLARVGPHHKSEAHSISQHHTLVPHGMPDMPSCLSAWLFNFPTVRRHQRTSMDG
ncbi:UNVERIFIED_CONTAM: hypothetical protein Sradi_6226000 [Sesamum radiatum]|uniref:Uncharacterized protein n=1 Tax=Sesamum radiatum TaxID=300843 RepID=A0AAW2KB01_SESRA